MTDSASAFEHFIQTGSHEAFAALVRGNLDLVYSAALRQVHDAAMAEDVTQSVFVILARKARMVGSGAMLSAWLLVTTRYAALDALRARARRENHERKAAEMRGGEADDKAADWEELSPRLDEMLAELSELDRQAIALRYFEGRTCEQIAAMLGCTANAAKQRVHRALEKLREAFGRKGIAVGAAALAGAIGAHAVRAAPGHLASAVISTAWSGGSGVAKGAAILMAAKANSAAVVIILVLLAAAGVMGFRLLHDSGSGSVAKNAEPRPVETKPADATQPAEAGGEDDWYARFVAAYGLADGQVVRQVAPPYIPERQRFWNELQRRPDGPHFPIPPGGHITFTYDAKEGFRWNSAAFTPPTMASLIQMGVKLKAHELDDWNAMNIRLTGDWVLSQSATVEQKLAALEPIILEKTGRKIHFEKRRVKREAIVVSGKYSFEPLAGAPPDDVIELLAGPRPAERRATQYGSLRDMCNYLENRTLKRYILEAEELPARISWRDDGAERLDDILHALRQQTGLRFEREMREMEVWFGVEKGK